MVLAEFGTKRDPLYPDKDTYAGTAGPVRFDGQLHNQIPKLAADDDSTVWQPDCNVAHHQDLYFGKGEESLESCYELQSPGRYSVDGEVAGWVKVDDNEARYGRSTGPGLHGPKACGEDALCAHRSYVLPGDQGRTRPAYGKFGGTPVGDAGLSIGDHNMQPENGGVSVFTHEYGHDLGLPDHDDTNGGDNGVEDWNLMAQSRLNAAGEPLGARAGDLSAWDKLHLGWQDYETVRAGQKRTLEIGPHEYNTVKAQAIVGVLPQSPVTTQLGARFAGTRQYFSGNADDLSTSLTVPLDLTRKSGAVFTGRVCYSIEEDHDYLYVHTSTDGGKTWTSLPGRSAASRSRRTAAGSPLPFAKDGIDAHPAPLVRLDGQLWRSRVQVFDAPFSKQDAASFTLHLNGVPQNIRSRPANPSVNDLVGYYPPAAHRAGLTEGRRVDDGEGAAGHLDDRRDRCTAGVAAPRTHAAGRVGDLPAPAVARRAESGGDLPVRVAGSACCYPGR